VKDINDLYFQTKNEDFVRNELGRGQWVQVAGRKEMNSADKLSYTFVPTALGLAATIKCSCGQDLLLCHDLGYSARALYLLSNTATEHYHDVKLPKANGEFRLLHVPDKYMKSVQRSIARNLLAYEDISSYALAYRPGGSTRNNAKRAKDLLDVKE